jgi:uncharacterized membrane protein
MWACAVIVLAACMSGLLAGFFFAFTNAVSPALAVIDHALAGAALDAVYGHVRHWPFQLAFFATIAIALATLAAPLAIREGRAWKILVVLAASCVMIGMLGVTGLRIAPAGRALAEAGAGISQHWDVFLADWRFWNDLRTLGAAMATVLYLVALGAAPPLWRRPVRSYGGGKGEDCGRWARLVGKLSARASQLMTRLAETAPARFARPFWTKLVAPVLRIVKCWFGPLGNMLMNRPSIVLGIAVALFAVMTGFFWAFATVVMPALGALTPGEALATLHAINREVRNIVFALLFFGGVSIIRNVAGFALFATPGLTGILTLLAGGVYALGVLVLTLTMMVPINAEMADVVALSALPGADTADPAIAEALLAQWAILNMARTLAGALALAMLAAALFLAAGREPRTRS